MMESESVTACPFCCLLLDLKKNDFGFKKLVFVVLAVVCNCIFHFDMSCKSVL